MRERMLAGDPYIADDPDIGAAGSAAARCLVNFGLVALDVAAISIGDDVQIGPDVQLLTPTHRWSPSRGGRSGRRPGRSRSATTSGWAAG